MQFSIMQSLQECIPHKRISVQMARFFNSLPTKLFTNCLALVKSIKAVSLCFALRPPNSRI